MSTKKALYTRAQIKQLEQHAVSHYAITEWEMMQRAGLAGLLHLTQIWPDIKTLVVLCGGGNNGGDGYVLARLAHQAGYGVHVYYLKDPEYLTGAAKQAYLTCQQAQVAIQPFNPDLVCDTQCLCVDALLGTGLKGKVNEPYLSAIHWLNHSNCPTLALDIPSGLDADTGVIYGDAVTAQHTLTFIGYKIGLFMATGVEVCGQIHCADLALPLTLKQAVPYSAQKLTLAHYQQRYLMARPRGSHKGDFGHGLLIGGFAGMPGAIRMAAQACIQSGAGLTTVATEKQHVTALIHGQPEIMAHGLADEAQLKPLINKADVIAIGPGLGQAQWQQTLLKNTLAEQKTYVIDADALNILAHKPQYYSNWILTPHPGEAVRLLQTTTAAVTHNRLDSVCALQRRYGGVVVLKGAGTLICDPQQNVYLCPYGNPGMASGGMGDVLTGIITALLAQQYSLTIAACLAVIVHACAADNAAIDWGERGLHATDLFPYLRKLLNPCKN
jgi:NAD(P)H-hydrate epimerase